MSAEYYVDSQKGSDNNSGQLQNKPWKTIAKVNQYKFLPEDTIYFRKNRIWRETLVVNSSGGNNRPITYSAYGEGHNPLILTTEYFDNWKLALENNEAKIWQGKILGIRNHWGAVKDGKRTPKYFGYKNKNHSQLSAPKSLAKMENGFFYSPLNKEGFFYRNDHGHPGAMEVGARRYGITIRNKQYIVIDGLDVSGPGGDRKRGGESGVALISVDNSDYVIIKNSSVSNNIRNGIRIENGSTHSTVDHVRSFGHGATGIYLWEAGIGNRIINSEVFDCGTVSTDTGDMGLIGVWLTPNAQIESCYVHNNGHVNVDHIDTAISIVQSPSVLVTKNRVSFSGGGGIQLAESSDNGKISNNIVDKWCVFGDSFTKKNTHCEGIRIGGGVGSSTSKNINILNNSIMNGLSKTNAYAALRVTAHNSEGLRVRKNIFTNNGNNYNVIADSKNKKPHWYFYGNSFDGKSAGIKVLGKIFKSSQYEKLVSNYFSRFGSSWHALQGAQKNDVQKK
jgi:hypothetical protein